MLNFVLLGCLVCACFLLAYMVACGLEIVARRRMERQALSAAKVINEAHQERNTVKVVPIQQPENFVRQAEGFDVTDLFGGR